MKGEIEPLKSSRRQFLSDMGHLTLGAAMGGLLQNGCALPTPASARKRPKNILFLMTDQHRPDALGCYGSPYARTPALDALAASGMSFRRTYCQHPLCSPSRNAIIFGRYAHSTGIWDNNIASSRELISFPQHLRANGYKTACIGKLHIDGRSDLDWDVLWPTVPCWKIATNPDEKYRVSNEPMLAYSVRGGQPFGRPSPFARQVHIEWMIKERTIQFMKENRGKPWFLQCSFEKPHPPFQPPQEYWNMFKRSDMRVPRYPPDDLDDIAPGRRQFHKAFKRENVSDEDVIDAMIGHYGNLAFCDDLFGEVLVAMDDIGIREDTLVVYTSDHGEMLYDHRLWHKCCFFEQSVRVPLIMRLPGLVPEGVHSYALTEHIDLFPTFMALLALSTPESVQGKSLLHVLTGKSKKHRKFVHSEGTYWWPEFTKVRMYFDGRYKFIDNGPDVPPELYDHKNDPLEITNVAGRPEHHQRVGTWASYLREWSRKDVIEVPGDSLSGKKI